MNIMHQIQIPLTLVFFFISPMGLSIEFIHDETQTEILDEISDWDDLSLDETSNTGLLKDKLFEVDATKSQPNYKIYFNESAPQNLPQLRSHPTWKISSLGKLNFLIYQYQPHPSNVNLLETSSKPQDMDLDNASDNSDETATNPMAMPEDDLNFTFMSQGDTLKFKLSVMGQDTVGLRVWVNDELSLSLLGQHDLAPYTVTVPVDEAVTIRLQPILAPTTEYQSLFISIQDISIPSEMDTDFDAINDMWEYFYFADLTHDTDMDGDHDQLSLYQEYVHQTSPLQPDTDQDSYLDGWEVRHIFNPLYNDSSFIETYREQMGENYFQIGLEQIDRGRAHRPFGLQKIRVAATEFDFKPAKQYLQQNHE